MFTRRMFLQGSAGMAATGLLPGAASALQGDPVHAIQARIDILCRLAREWSGANAAAVVGIVTPDSGENGRFLFAGREGLTSIEGQPLALDENTLLAIGSISKVFTSGIHYMLHGPYQGALGDWLGKRMTMSAQVAGITLKNLAVYEPGLAQDNHGGVYPPRTMEDLLNLFAYMGNLVPPSPQGSCYTYSNAGWALLGMASERLDSLDTGAFIDRYDGRLKEFCAKFAAPHISAYRPELARQMPMGYTRRRVPVLPGPPYRPTNPAGLGSGGIVSSGADMLRFLLYNTGRLPGGLADPALAYQQTETFQVPNCSGAHAPATSYGWFHIPVDTPQGQRMVLSKDGAVRGFTSWMGYTGWQGTGAPATHGVFVLSNALESARIGRRAMRTLLGAA